MTTTEAALRDALAPFIQFFEIFDAQPNRHQDDEIYVFHNRHGRAVLRMSDIRRLTALSQPVAAPQAETAGARYDMLQTAAELRANSNGDPSAIQQAMYWERKAAALAPPQPEGGTVVDACSLETALIANIESITGWLDDEVTTADLAQAILAALQPEKTKP